jgi:hypothetical protein
MSNSASSVIQRELSPGEQVLWSGQPRGGIRMRAIDAFVIPFSILWCGFAIFWEVMALTASSKAPGPLAIIFPVFGVPFVLIGLYMVFGRFIVEAKARERTFYGVTNERIIIVSGLFSRRTKSLNLRTLTDISLTERADGSGSVSFGPSNPFSQWFPVASWPGAGQFVIPSFDLIDRAREVYDLLRKTQRAATS